MSRCDIRIEGERMCLHSAYEAGGVVYVRALGGPAGPGSDSNTSSNAWSDDLDHPTEPEGIRR